MTLIDITLRPEHIYFLPRHGLVFDAHWPRTPRAGLGWIRALFGRSGFGGLDGHVDPEALAEAVRLVKKQDVESATRAFTELGYAVTVQAHALQ